MPFSVTADASQLTAGIGGFSVQVSEAGSYSSTTVNALPLWPPSTSTFPSTTADVSQPRGVGIGVLALQEFAAGSYTSTVPRYVPSNPPKTYTACPTTAATVLALGVGIGARSLQVFDAEA